MGDLVRASEPVDGPLLVLQQPELGRKLSLLLLLQAEAPIPRERLDAMIDGNIQLAQELRVARTRVGFCSRTATCMTSLRHTATRALYS